MNNIIKSTIAACGFLAAVLAPFNSGADTYVFSGKGATGQIWGSNGNLYIQVTAFESTTQEKSNKSGSSGAYVYGSYYTGTECWNMYGSTDTIQFKATGSLPKQVTASGVVSVTWHEYCSGLYPTVTDTITFNENLTTLKDQASSSWGTNHNEYGNYRVNSNYDYNSAPASINNSFISSQYFGSVIPNGGYVGQSKSHNVQINK